MKKPLPKIDYPVYKLKIPSTGKTIRFRTFTVREERNLLTALEGKDFGGVIEAIKQLVTNCTMGDVDPNTLTTYDLELLFLHLRAKSVGEEVQLSLYKKNCPKKDGKEPCEQPTEFAVNLMDAKVVVKGADGKHTPFDPATSKKKSDIRLTDTVVVTMKHPGFEEYEIGKNFLDQKKAVNEVELEMIARCISTIADGEDMLKAEDYTIEERMDFLKSLDKKSMEKLEEFFESVPKVRYECEYQCGHCEHKEPYVLEDIQNFLNAR